MCDFTTALPEASTLDPKKRVHHTTGLVLGVDEFRQDQLYFMERDHLHQRALHGYGAVMGLDVRVRAGASGRPEVVVDPGMALTPRGESVCVPLTQCAPLDDWLERNTDELLGSPPVAPPGDVSVWVTLCYRECEDDRVPILGDPCRTLEDATAPSRIADDFALSLSLTPPDQEEEDTVRAFGTLLRSLEVTSEAGSWLTPAEFADMVRALVPSSPPAGSPPVGSPPGTLVIHRDDLPRAMALAFRVWTTEVRPQLASGAAGCPGGGEACIQLARLDFSYEEDALGELQVVGDHTNVTVAMGQRPTLLSTRLLQEWLLAAWAAPRHHHDLDGLDDDDHLQYLLVDPATRALVADLDADGPNGPRRITGLAAGTTNGDAVRFEQAVKNGDSAGGDLDGNYPDPQVAGLRGNPIAEEEPEDGQVLTFDSGSGWTPREAAGGGGGVTDHSALTGLGDDDHPQYLLVDPATRAMVGDLNANGPGGPHRVTGLAAAANNGDAVRFEQAVKVGDLAGGDLSATFPNPRVRRLHGRLMANVDPNPNDVLTWDGVRWRPLPVSGGVPDLVDVNLVRIVSTSWFHGGSTVLSLTHDESQLRGLAVAFGFDLGNFADLDPSTLDDESVRLWVRTPDQDRRFMRHLEVITNIIPARVVGELAPGRLTETRSLSAGEVPNAVVIQVPESLISLWLEVQPRLTVELRGDHIRAEDGRAIDAEFVRSELPTGDRSAGAGLGLQGGKFESWITVRPLVVRGVDLNTATQNQIVAIPGIGPTLASRIVQRRQQLRGLNSLEDLRGVAGVSNGLINRLTTFRG